MTVEEALKVLEKHISHITCDYREEDQALDTLKAELKRLQVYEDEFIYNSSGGSFKK